MCTVRESTRVIEELSQQLALSQAHTEKALEQAKVDMARIKKEKAEEASNEKELKSFLDTLNQGFTDLEDRMSYGLGTSPEEIQERVRSLAGIFRQGSTAFLPC